MPFPRGEQHPNWKGGKSVTRDGYIRLKAGRNRDKLEHRKVWEEANGPIPFGFDVHHKDEDRSHNELSNLELRPSFPHREEVIRRINSGKRNHLTQSG